MKKILLILISFFFYTSTNASNLVYPIQEMSKLNDRFSLFSTLNNSQKRTLPIIDEHKYSSIAKMNGGYNEYTRIYTVLWGSTYKYGWDVGHGGHGGIDIASAKGTPVYSIFGGKIIYAGEKGAWGNLVGIEHTINGRKIVSSYAHLSKILVKYGDKINGDTKIGEVGSTGNSTGNHLHFQIDSDSAPFHPYYSHKQTFNQLQGNTIDPIAFLNSNGANIKKIVNKEDKVEIKGLLTREEIQEREIKTFLKYHKLSLKYKTIGNNLALGDKGILKLKVTNSRGKPFNGTLPGGGMKFITDNSFIKLLPSKLISVEKGNRDIILTPIKPGKIKIKALLGKHTIKYFSLNIYNPDKKIYPTSGIILGNSHTVIGDIKTGAIVLKDSNNTNLINLRYSGNYEILSKDNNIDLCIKKGTLKTISRNLNKSCSMYSNRLSFNYSDTVLGILLYKYRINNLSKTQLNLVNSSNDKLFTVKKLHGLEPKGLKNNYKFYNEIIKNLEMSIITIYKKGYFSQDGDINKSDSIKWINNALLYAYNKTTNTKYKNLIEKKILEIKSEEKGKFTKITKKDFLNLVGKYLIFNDIANISILNKYKDLSNNENKIINYISKKSNFWKDKKFPTYFKSNENITRGEVSYILYKILKF